jgi:hypothetical protein
MSALAEAWSAYGGTLPRGSDFDGEQNAGCALHDDRTASARVNLDKGLFFCNSCAIGGDIHTLVMKAEGVEFAEAKRIVQERWEFSEGEPGSKVNAPFTGKRPGRKGAWKPTWMR